MWSSLKKIIKSKHDKCIIIEDGKPSYVVIPFEEYQHLQERVNNSMVDERFSSGDNLEDSPNSELLASSRQEKEDSFFDEDERHEKRKNEYSSSISIEDLPF